MRRLFISVDTGVVTAIASRWTLNALLNSATSTTKVTYLCRSLCCYGYNFPPALPVTRR